MSDEGSPASRWRFWIEEAPSLPPRIRKVGDALVAEIHRLEHEQEMLALALLDCAERLTDKDKREMGTDTLAAIRSMAKRYPHV